MSSTQEHTTTRSLVEILGPDISRCGYCARAHSSHAFGVWAHRLRVADYQNLIDAGWRRSGRYLYRPDLAATCCPPFPIRLDAARFTPSSTHRRVLKRLRRAANFDDTAPPTATPPSQPSQPQQQSKPHLQQQRHRPKEPQPNQQFRKRKQRLYKHDAPSHANLNSTSRNLVEQVITASLAALAPHANRAAIRVFPARCPPSLRGSSMDQSSGNPTATPAPAWTCNAPHVLAAADRRAASATSAVASAATNAKGSADASASAPSDPAPSGQPRSSQEWAALLIPALRAKIPEGWCVSAAAGFLNFSPPVTLSEGNSSETCGMEAIDGLTSEAVDNGDSVPQKSKPQTAASERTKLGDAASSGLPVTGAFSMQLVPAQYVPEAYELFRRYQMAVHKEERSQCGRETYRRFLVDSPLIHEDERSVSTASGGSASGTRGNKDGCQADDEDREEVEGDSGAVGYGSFHILYRLGGRLFAVGVVDILPKCLSSVYLFYDPEYARLSPGTLAALKEIEWVQTRGRDYPALRFYYMGFYIHGCAKMRYKAGFTPSELLCNETRRWVDAAAARAVLDGSGDGEDNDDVAKRRPKERLAVRGVSPGRAASQFDIDDDEMERLVGDSLFHIRVESGEAHVVKLRTLEPLLAEQWATQFEVLRGRLAALIRLVGRTTSRAYEFLLWGQAQYGS